MLENVPAGCIAAIIPDYEINVGNITRIIDKDGKEQVVYKTVKTLLRKLAGIYAVDLSALRVKYAALLNQQNIIPLGFNENLILIPFKMRKPITKNDGSLGYINLSSIEKLQKKDNDNTDIILLNGNHLKSIVSYATAYKHLKNAQLVKQYYLNLHSGNGYIQAAEELYSQYQQPATKNDIAILTDQIVELKHYLKGMPYV